MPSNYQISKGFAVIAKYEKDKRSTYAEHDEIYIDVPILNIMDVPDDLSEKWNINKSDFDEEFHRGTIFSVEDLYILDECGFNYNGDEHHWIIYV